MARTNINIDTLVSTLRNHPDLSVVFTQNEHSISQGYHVTEVKYAVVDSLDCGQGTDQWSELVVQLLDGSVNSKSGYMQAAKLLGILDKSLEKHQQGGRAKLYFEFAPGNAMLQKLSVENIAVVNDSIVVSLKGSLAQCKPLQRVLEGSIASLSGAGCCGSSAGSNSS